MPSYTFKGREANQTADTIAKRASSFPIYHAILDNFTPDWFKLMVDLDGSQHFCSVILKFEG